MYEVASGRYLNEHSSGLEPQSAKIRSEDDRDSLLFPIGKIPAWVKQRQEVIEMILQKYPAPCRRKIKKDEALLSEIKRTGVRMELISLILFDEKCL